MCVYKQLTLQITPSQSNMNTSVFAIISSILVDEVVNFMGDDVVNLDPTPSAGCAAAAANAVVAEE